MVGLALVAEDAQASEASLRAALAAALEENRELRQVAAELWEDNAGLRERQVLQAVELERLRADLAVSAADAVRAVLGAVTSGAVRR